MDTPQWIVVADSRRASLYACQPAPGRGWRLKAYTRIDTALPVSRRPSPANDAERDAVVACSHARAVPCMIAVQHTEGEEQRRFAREVAAWLVGAQLNVHARHVTVFAPAEFLASLHDAMRNRVPSSDLREAELTRLRPHELAAHPSVVSALADP